jgi:DNA-binding ferritin-like protein
MNLITNLLTLHNQLKVYHWQTRSFAAHRAFGKAYDAMTLLIDQFVEVYQGKNGLVKAQNNFTITLRNLNGNDDANKFIESFLDYLMGPLVNSLDTAKDTDLMNIRDEMSAELNKLKYLLTLS